MYLGPSKVARLSLGGRHVADRFEQAASVEPIDPFEGGELDCLEGSPRPTAMDYLGLEQTVDRLGQGVVLAVPDATDRGLDACLRQPLRVAQSKILAPPVAMVHEPAALNRTAFVQGLFQRVEHEGGVSRAGDPPADDAPGIGIDHEGHVDKAGPGRDVGEVADSQGVGTRRLELAVHPVERAGRDRVWGDAAAQPCQPLWVRDLEQDCPFSGLWRFLRHLAPPG